MRKKKAVINKFALEDVLEAMPGKKWYKEPPLKKGGKYRLATFFKQKYN